MGKYCPNCGKEVNENAVICVNCGVSLNGKNNVVNGNKNNSLAVAGFVTSIVSLIINLWGIVGLLALILSVIGLVQISNNKEKGKGLAIAGIIIGAFSIVYAAVIIINYMNLYM